MQLTIIHKIQCTIWTHKCRQLKCRYMDLVGGIIILLHAGLIFNKIGFLQTEYSQM
jgi:hypothetical protein